MFTSDNGPWLAYGEHAGDCLPFREGKGTTWEGGQREPTIFNWPGTIEPGTVCEAPCGAIDLLPTVADLSGEDLPDDRVIDGESLLPLLTGETDESPHEALYFYWGRELQAVRSGDFKLHFPHEYRSLLSSGGRGGSPAPYVQERIGKALFNLRTNPSETRDVASRLPARSSRKLEALADAARASLGDSRTGAAGNAVRPPGRVGE